MKFVCVNFRPRKNVFINPSFLNLSFPIATWWWCCRQHHKKVAEPQAVKCFMFPYSDTTGGVTPLFVSNLYKLCCALKATHPSTSMGQFTILLCHCCMPLPFRTSVAYRNTHFSFLCSWFSWFLLRSPPLSHRYIETHLYCSFETWTLAYFFHKNKLLNKVMFEKTARNK